MYVFTLYIFKMSQMQIVFFWTLIKNRGLLEDKKIQEKVLKQFHLFWLENH